MESPRTPVNALSSGRVLPSAASLANLRPWRPGQSGNPRGRRRAPRLTLREQLLILEALSRAADETVRQRAIEAFRACVTNPRTVLKAIELLARLNGELGTSVGARRRSSRR
jgi:hypothetical protein